MEKYYVSCIVGREKPWLCACTEAFPSEADAMEAVANYVADMDVLSVWVDQVEDGKTSVIYHKCYLDVLGGVRRP